ncbi:MAG: PDZ domain-containing protein [Veillonellaceae bacterium]|nr:PDZ domain-containing protein [Veillonellaceae bacterium]
MRRFRILVLLAVTLAMLGTATVCWAVDLTSGNRIDEGVWYKPTYLPSVDAAIGTLRNLGGRKAFCAWNGYTDGLDVNVDAFGLRVRGVMVATGSQYVANNGGYWVGNKYVPVIGGGFQQTKTEAEETAVVDFPKVSSVLVWHYPNLDRDNKWGVDIDHTDRKEVVAYRMPTLEIAREFADAVATLAVAAGSSLETYDGASIQRNAAKNAKLLKKLKWTADSGIVVFDVAPGSPAAAAKLQKDDILIEANGVVLRDQNQYRRLIKDTLGDKPEAKFDLKIVRAGVQLPLTMTLANFNSGAAAVQKPGQPAVVAPAKPSLGVDLAALTADEAKAAGVPGGLKIISLKPDGVAAKSQLKANDILLALNGKPTPDAEALRQILAAEQPKQFKIWRDGGEKMIEVVQSF